MRSRTLRQLLTLVALVLVPSMLALAQAPQTRTWDGTQQIVIPKQKLYVVTTAQPMQRRYCMVSNVTDDQLVCQSRFGKAHTYRTQDIAAIITPGEHTVVFTFLAFAGATAAATWGTIVVAATCPLCAVATGAAAGFLFICTLGSGFEADGDRADALLYLAPGQTLRVK